MSWFGKVLKWLAALATQFNVPIQVVKCGGYWCRWLTGTLRRAALLRAVHRLRGSTMRRRLLFLTAALLFVSATLSPVVVQSSRQQDLDTLEQQVQKLYREGKYSEAIPYAERYVAITKEALGEGEEYVGALNLLALNYKAFSPLF